MADQKVTALTEETSPALADILYIVDDPGGTPTSKKFTIQNLLDVVHFAGFHAYTNGNQSVNSGTKTVMEFDTETFDIGSDFNTTNYRWTPPAGYVIVGVTLYYAECHASGQWAIIYKNGTDVSHHIVRPTTQAVPISASTIWVGVADGDDYFEGVALHYKGSAMNVDADALKTFFWGFVIPQS